jgi:anti-sigma B factor antagonist
VTYISSAGLRTLADVLTKNKRTGGDLKLAALTPRVRRVLEIIGFDNFFSITSTAEEAIAEFRGTS